MEIEECIKIYSELSTILGICGASLSLPIVKRFLISSIKIATTKSTLVLRKIFIPILRFLLNVVNILTLIIPFLIGYALVIGVFGLLSVIGFLDLLDIVFNLWEEYIYHAAIIFIVYMAIAEIFRLGEKVKEVGYKGCAIYWMSAPILIFGIRFLIGAAMVMGGYYGFKLVTNTEETLQKTWEIIRIRFSKLKAPKRVLERSIPYLAFCSIAISLLIKHLLTIKAICN